MRIDPNLHPKVKLQLYWPEKKKIKEEKEEEKRMRFFRMQHPPCAHIPGAKTPFREGQAMPGRHSSPKPSPLLFSSCNFLAHCLPAFLPIWAAAIDCVAQWRPKANGMFQGAHGNWKSHWMTHWETTGTGGLTVLREQCPMGTNCLSSLEKIHKKKPNQIVHSLCVGFENVNLQGEINLHSSLA